VNKEWHDSIFQRCDAEQYSSDAATDEQFRYLSELERAYRELYYAVYTLTPERKDEN
jgi:hypothetical protein